MSYEQSAIESIKGQARKEFDAMLDSYMGSYEAAVENKKLTIDMIEDFIGQAKANSERIIKEAGQQAAAVAESKLTKKRPMPQMRRQS